MDAFRSRGHPPSDRFLGLFSSSSGPPNAAGAGSGDELHEDEVFWTGSDFSAGSKPSVSPSPSPSAPPRTFRGLAEKNFGILAALPEEDQKQAALRKTSFVKPIPAPSSPSSSPSSARMIPAIPKPKQADAPLSSPGGKMLHQSAPVNVPVVPRRRSSWLGEGQEQLPGGDYEDDEVLPPHEMVARKDTPMTTFSVLEGAGRTLKGRDLRRVRNAVWRQTGFMD